MSEPSYEWNPDDVDLDLFPPEMRPKAGSRPWEPPKPKNFPLQDVKSVEPEFTPPPVDRELYTHVPSRKRRLVGGAIDSLPIYLLFVIVGVKGIAAPGSSLAREDGLLIGILWLFFVLNGAVLQGKFGFTIGKFLTRQRLLYRRGPLFHQHATRYELPGIGRGLLWCVGRYFDLFWFIGPVLLFVGTKGRTLAEMFSGTEVAVTPYTYAERGYGPMPWHTTSSRRTDRSQW